MTNSKDGISKDDWKPKDLFGNKVDVPYRVCEECGIPKHPRKFTRRLPICKPCRAAIHREEYQTNARKRAQTLIGMARVRARDQGVVFELDIDWLEDKIEHGICEVTGIPFDLSTEGDQSKNPRAPSVDRLVGSEGYTKENARVVCWMYNAAKGEANDNEVLKMAFALVERAVTEGSAA